MVEIFRQKLQKKIGSWNISVLTILFLSPFYAYFDEYFYINYDYF